MAAAVASVSMATAVPVTSCAMSSYSSDRAVHMSSSASFGGMRLKTASVATPTSVSRSSNTLIVRASEEPSLWGRITGFVTGIFESGKEKASEVAGQGEKELNKAKTEAKSASGDLGNKAESLKEDSQAQAEEAAEQVKVGVEELKEKVEDAVESAKAK